MRIYITTTEKNHITELEIVDGNPGDTANAVWQSIVAGDAMEAGLAHSGDKVIETRQIVFNPQHVVSVHEMPE